MTCILYINIHTEHISVGYTIFIHVTGNTSTTVLQKVLELP